MSTDRDWLRERLEELERIQRPSASEGERRAAEWLVARFAELGAEGRIEAEPAHGTYWWPLGIGAALMQQALAAARARQRDASVPAAPRRPCWLPGPSGLSPSAWRADLDVRGAGGAWLLLPARVPAATGCRGK